MNKRLANYANASAGKREDNVFRVLQYLNTQRYEFTPADIRTRVSVENKTILSYLWEIAKSQTCDRPFLDRVRSGEGVQWYLLNQRYSNKERDVSNKVYTKLLKIVEDGRQEKGQFTYDFSDEFRPMFYYRLEWSLMFYELVSN